MGRVWLTKDGRLVPLELPSKVVVPEPRDGCHQVEGIAEVAT